jgi:hypothetical protein
LYATALPRALAALTLSLMLGSCGGGNEGESPLVPLARAAAPHAAALQTASPRTPSATALMDWAQGAYPAFFPGRKGNIAAAQYLYRYYPETGNYVGTSGNAVYIMGPVSGGPLKQVGVLSDFSCNVYPDSCAPGAADSRSGTYTAYATTGERFTLTIDFDAGNYTVGSPQTTLASLGGSGTFTNDSVAGSYLFQGPGMGATTGFRYVDDLIVGTFPVSSGVRPFVAARNFAQSIAEVAGAYSSFGINHANNADDSRIFTQRINTNGTLQICTDNIIYSIANCPAASVLNYTLSVNGDLFTAAPADPAGTFSFRVAKAGNENIFLMGSLNFSTGARFFRIAVAEAGAFNAGSARGGSAWGEWGTTTYTTNSYAYSGVGLNGTPVNLGGTLAALGPTGPSGMRSVQGGGSSSSFFVMQNTQLGLLIGPRNSVVAGYMQIGSR